MNGVSQEESSKYLEQLCVYVCVTLM